MKILILGANGFIGSHLCETILDKTDWQISALDLVDDNILHLINHPRLSFKLGDMNNEKTWITQEIESSDVVLPLVAIAMPALYVQNPLRIFELDFEANLEIVRQCVKFKKRIIFPSTSEVYGMCDDAEFDEEESHFVTGPTHKERWIYAASKQLLDRVIYAYGKHHGLTYSLFRPFNWYGPRLDNIKNAKAGGSRVLTQFIGNILRGEAIQLVNGGAQKRCFTYIDDGIDALMKIIENDANCARNRIFNIGNPSENLSIRELAELLLDKIGKQFPEYRSQVEKVKLNDVHPDQYYGQGYQDIELRVPSISRARNHLKWEPTVNIETGVEKTLTYYFKSGVTR